MIVCSGVQFKSSGPRPSPLGIATTSQMDKEIVLSKAELVLLLQNMNSEYLESNEASIPTEAQSVLLRILELSGRPVEFNLCDNSSVAGFVYIIDPERQGFLIVPCGPTAILNLPSVRGVFIMMKGISSLRTVASENRLDVTLSQSEVFLLNRKDSVAADSKKLNEKIRSKADVLQILSANRLPFDEGPDGVIMVLNVLALHPPYNSRSCYCNNEIILQKVREILDVD
jgi:hypothetical protein